MTSSAEEPAARWLELSVTVGAEAVEAVSEILGRVTVGTALHPTRLIHDPDDELAARPDPDAPWVVRAHIDPDDTASDRIEATERALWHLQAFGLGPVGPLRVRAVDDADWAGAWREHYVAQRIGRVVIVPSWVDEPLRPGEVAVRLDPGMAFGTGLHPTTRGCLALLGELAPMPSGVLDVGCGSGILALAALALGAERAVGFDTDPLAIDATHANAALNAVTARVTTVHGTLPPVPDERHPLVLANLVAAVLIDLAGRLAAHTAGGGTLLASGIIAPRADEVRTALTTAGLRVVDRREDGEWVSLRMERPG